MQKTKKLLLEKLKVVERFCKRSEDCREMLKQERAAGQKIISVAKSQEKKRESEKQLSEQIYILTQKDFKL